MAVDEDDLEYVTRVDVNIAILRAIERMAFREKLRQVMPLIAKHLAAAGVDFSKVDFSRATEPTDEELDAVYDDLRRLNPPVVEGVAVDGKDTLR